MVHLLLGHGHDLAVKFAQQSAAGLMIVVAGLDQPLRKARHQRTQLRSRGKALCDLLQRPKTMQHPELCQRHADFWLVVIVFVVPAAGLEADALGVFARKAQAGLGQRRVRLNGKHLVGVENLKQIRQSATEMCIRRLPQDGIGRLGDQLVQRLRPVRKLHDGWRLRMGANPQFGEWLRVAFSISSRSGMKW